MKKSVKIPTKVERVVEVVTEETTQIVDVEGGFETVLGKEIVLLCDSYIYSGTLTGVNGIFLEISSPHIVYETGSWTGKKWKDAQPLPDPTHNVMISKIESWSAR